MQRESQTLITQNGGAETISRRLRFLYNAFYSPSLMIGCPDALSFALSAATPVVLSAVQRARTAAASVRAFAHAATWFEVGATSAFCIAIDAASRALLTLSNVGARVAPAPPTRPPP